jgi:mannosyltransferase
MRALRDRDSYPNPAGVPTGAGAAVTTALGRIELLIVLLALILGVALRLIHGGFSLDTDEAFSAGLASQPFPAMIQGALEDRTHPPLHLLLLHGWFQLFGTSEAAARALSLCAFAGFILVAGRILRRYATGFVLGGALLLFAVSPLYVYYGAMVRPYALVMLTSALVFERYLALVDDPHDRARRWTWALACGLAMATQYLAAPLIGACVVAALTRGRRVAVPAIAFGAAGALAVAPWLVVAMLPASGGKPLAELIQWMGKPSLDGFVWFYASAFGVPTWGRLAYVLLIVLVLACLPLADAARGSVAPGAAGRAAAGVDPRRRHDVLLWALVAFVLPLVAFLVSVLSSYTVFVTRQLLGSQFALVMLLVLGLRLVPRPAAAGAIVALLGWTAGSTQYSLPVYTRPDWREVAAAVRDSGRPFVAGELWVQWPLEHYVGSPALRVGQDLDRVPADDFVIVCREPGCTEIRRQAREGRVVRELAVVATPPRRRESLRIRVEVLRICAERR